MTQLPLGIRNNNPLNIRRSDANPWEGRVKNASGDFEEFVKLEYGWRAAAKLILKHYDGQSSVAKQRGIKANTIRKLISIWAPPEDDNDTEAYIRFVSDSTGFLPDVMIPINRYEVMRPLLEAMAIAENGKKHATPTFSAIDDGLKMAGILPLRESALKDPKLLAPIAAGTLGTAGWISDALDMYSNHATTLQNMVANVNIKTIIILALVGTCIYMFYINNKLRRNFSISPAEDADI